MKCDKFCQDHQAPWGSPWDKDRCPTEPMQPNTLPHYCTRLHTTRKSLDFQYSTLPATLLPKASDHHVLVMMTAPRPNETDQRSAQSLLEKTCTSLLEAGFDAWPGKKLLCGDGIIVNQRSNLVNSMNWHFFETPGREGSARSFIRALRLALAIDPDLDSLTLLEDDIELCANALSYMKLVKIPADLAFITWFTYDYDWSSPRHDVIVPHPSSLAKNNSLLACRPSRFYILSQAVTFPRRTVDLLLSCPHIANLWLWPKRDGHDEMIAWALGDAPYAAHFPVLVQHMGGQCSAVSLDRASHGEESSSPVDPQAGARQSPHYMGKEFNALSLLPPIDP